MLHINSLCNRNGYGWLGGVIVTKHSAGFWYLTVLFLLKPMNTTESKPADSALKLTPPNCSLAPWNGLPIWHTIIQASFFDQQASFEVKTVYKLTYATRKHQSYTIIHDQTCTHLLCLLGSSMRLVSSDLLVDRRYSSSVPELEGQCWEPSCLPWRLSSILPNPLYLPVPTTSHTEHPLASLPW